MIRLFIKNCVLFFLGFSVIILIGLALPNSSKVRSIDYSLIKKHRLLDSIQEPKFILTGGSNVLFGFDSKLLSDSLHSPVINHAIHAGYGLKYILDDLEKFVHTGDTVILAPEYSHFFDDGYLGREPLLFSLSVKPSNLKLISIPQLIHILPEVPKFSLTRMRSFLSGMLKKSEVAVNNKTIYGEFAINRFGDNPQHWNLGKRDFVPYKFSGTFNTKALAYILKFQKKLEEKGASLIVTYPSLCNSSFIMNKAYIKEVKNKIENSTLTIVGLPKDFVYPDRLFFDTPYHLNGEGVQRRTKNLFQQIRKLKK